MNEQQLRIGDAEREQAAAALGEHFAQGRLTQDEHGERLDQVWSARTRGDLLPVFADLPGHGAQPFTLVQSPTWSMVRAPSRTPRGRGYWSSGLRPYGGLPAPIFVVLALLGVVAVLTHLPLILFGALVWFFVVGRHRHHRAASEAALVNPGSVTRERASRNRTRRRGLPGADAAGADT